MNQNQGNNKGFFLQLAELVVKRRLIFGLLFVALLVFSVFSIGWVTVEEDITEYLPDSAEAKQGLTIMSEEFTTYGTARVMVEYVTRDVARNLCEQISAVDNVFSVSFDDTEAHYKDGCALFEISFNGNENDEKVIAAMDEIKAVLGEHIYSVDSDVGFDLAASVMTDMVGVGILVAIVVVAVLVLTSSTFAEIPVLLGTFIFAAVINMGTNFVFSKVSFISYAIAVVLQLALSVDYAIILCNRYKEERERLPIKEAVTVALSKAIPEIAASSLTTIAGLGAMTFMNFRLGFDMGVSLIKAIAISLLSVFFFMPVLLCLLGKAMDKTKHRSFIPKISFVGKIGYAARFVLPPLFVALVIGAYVLFSHSAYAYDVYMIHSYKQNERIAATERVEEVFGKSNVIALLVPSGSYENEQALAEELGALDEVSSVLALADTEVMDGVKLADSVTYPEFAELAGVDRISAEALFAYYAAANGGQNAATADIANYKAPLVDLFLFLHDNIDKLGVELPAEQRETIDTLYDTLEFASVQLQGENYSRIILTTSLPTQSDESFRFLDRLHVIAEQYYPQGVVLTGNSVSAKDFSDSFGKDTTTVSLLSLAFVMLILLCTFKSIVLPVLLVLVIQGSIWLNFAIGGLRGYIFFMSYLIVSSIQMGANIDYAIVVSSRYSELRETQDKREAIISTMNLSFPTIITSGTMMVVAGYLLGYRVSQQYISQMGLFVGQGTLVTLCLVCFALPALLTLGDGLVRATTLKPRTVPTRSAKAAKAGLAVLTAAAMLAAVLASPWGLYRSVKRYNSMVDTNLADLETVKKLQDIADNLDRSREKYDEAKLSFAESLVTDDVGSEQLAEGQAQYDEGAAALEEGQAQYDDGAAQIEAAKAQLAAGQAQYNAGKKQYEEGKQRLAEGQAQYDAGAAQLAEAKQQYAEAEQQLNSVSGLYNSVKPAYDNMNSLEQQYNAAVAAGNTEEAAVLYLQWQGAKAIFDRQIGSTGYSIGSLMAAYEDAQAQLAAANVQISEAEAQLAAGKAELDAGYAELAEAEAQLAEGERKLNQGRAAIAAAEAQLAEGKEQLDAGYAELAEAGEQLEAGKQTLKDNETQLQLDLATLEAYGSSEEMLAAGVKALLENEAVAERAGKGASYGEILSAAKRVLVEGINDAYDEYHSALVGCVLALLALAAMFAAIIAANLAKHRAAVLAAGAGVLGGVAAAVYWKANCPHVYLLPMLTLFLLAVAALLLGRSLGNALTPAAAAAATEAVAEPAPNEGSPEDEDEI